MMVSLEDLEKINSVASSSGVFIGILGGLIKALNTSKRLGDGIVKVVVGCVVSWVSSPFVIKYLPVEFYPMAIFMLGYGGTEVIDFFQNALREFLANKVDSVLARFFGPRKTNGGLNENQQK
jgi:hypothetical protein